MVLNLNGHTLTGDGGGGAGVRAEGTEANPTLEGLRVENGTVTGFDDGILLDDAPGARVTSVTARATADGIDVDDSPGARFEGNTANGNSVDGIDVDQDGRDGCRGSPGNRPTATATTASRIDGLSTGSIVVDGQHGVERATPPTGNGGAGIDLTAATSTTAASAATRPPATGRQRDRGGRAARRATGWRATRRPATPTLDLVDANLPGLRQHLARQPLRDRQRGRRPGAGCIQ